MLLRLSAILLMSLASYSSAVENAKNDDDIGFRSTAEDQFVTLDWSMSAPTYSLGDPVFATLSITNTSSEMVYIVFSNPIDISNPSMFQDGKAVPLTAYGTSNLGEGLNHLSLKLSPGKSSEALVFLSRTFDLSTAGVFRACAKVHYLDHQAKAAVLNANPIQFEIVDMPDGMVLEKNDKK